ncbi:hypothetical protein [uncultured Arthrobacter sp.]|uniref:hypothetical protein n=1 Tax=uncultured Arthrobacter sp. TaxID=114050 RepID=UPI0026368877|nr:hypothetical protein [uncultured Arthrobacter sp.]
MSNAVPALPDKDRDFYQAYYLLQAQRQAQHETNRLAVSGFVLAASPAAVGLLAGTEEPTNALVSIVLVSVVVLNILAALYAQQSRYWVKVHQKRARWVLEKLAPELVGLHEAIRLEGRKKILAAKSGDGSFISDAVRSERLLITFHLVFIVGAAGFLAWALFSALA